MTEDNGRKETQILITVSRSLNPQILRRKKNKKEKEEEKMVMMMMSRGEPRRDSTTALDGQNTGVATQLLHSFCFLH